MKIELDKIIIPPNRIRKIDPDTIPALAEDINRNGLANPPTVTPDFNLIAGERRVAAMKYLGWNQTEVNVMTVRDAQHALELEISENIQRQDFNKEERVLAGIRLEELERLKAKERQSEAGKTYGVGMDSQKVRENFPEAISEGRARDIIATKLGIGSGRQYEKEKFIYENRRYLPAEEYDRWKSGDAKTGGVYETIREKIRTEQSRDNLTQLFAMIPQLEQLVDTGIVTNELAAAIINELPHDDKTALIENTPEAQELAERKIAEYIDANSDADQISALKEQIASLKADNKMKQEMVDSVTADNKNKNELIEKYQDQIENDARKKKSIVRSALTPDSDYCMVEAITEVAALIDKTRKLLIEDLAPLKYQPYIYAVITDDRIRANLRNMLDLMNEWCKDIGSCLDDYENKNIVEMEEVYAITQ